MNQNRISHSITWAWCKLEASN